MLKLTESSARQTNKLEQKLLLSSPTGICSGTSYRPICYTLELVEQYQETYSVLSLFSGIGGLSAESVKLDRLPIPG